MGRFGNGDNLSPDDSKDVDQKITASFVGANMATTGVGSKPVEGCLASSSQSQIRLKSDFIDMGFSRPLVDRVFREIGGKDEALLLNTLCTYSVVEESPADMFISENDNLTPTRNEEDNFGNEYKDSDGSQGSDVKFLPDEGSASVTPAAKRASLQMMNFSPAEIDIAFERMGVEASVEALVDFIIAKQAVNDSGTMDAPLTVGGESVQKGDPYGNYDINEDRSDQSNLDGMNEASSSSIGPKDTKLKKPKLSNHDMQTDHYKIRRSDAFGPLISPRTQGKVASNAFEKHPSVVSELPYFLYGNVLEVPETSWEKVSRFLHAQPEFVDSKYFSAIEREEAYVHNLPRENRSGIIPPSPTTIQEALPHVENWWPPWDKRRKIGTISSTDSRVSEVCQSLRRTLVQSQGMPSSEDRSIILHQCKTHNLVWTGQCTTSMIELEDMEHLFGYPKSHTSGFDYAARLMLLKYGFQVDTLCYHISGLRKLFPRINVLSMNTGIGGALVALHKLGVHLNHVVSVEPSHVNKVILKRWWKSTSQSGKLIECYSFEKMTPARIKRMVEELGGFQLVVGQNPGKFIPGQGDSKRDSHEDLNFPLFFEFYRVLSCVSETMRNDAKDVSS